MWNFFVNCWIWSWKTEWTPCWQLTREYHREQQADAAALPWTTPNHTTWIFFKERRDSASSLHHLFPSCVTQSSVCVWCSNCWGKKSPTTNNLFTRDDTEATNSVHIGGVGTSSLSQPQWTKFSALNCMFSFWGTLASSWGWLTCSGWYLKDLLHGIFACIPLSTIRQEPVLSWGLFPVWLSDACQDLKLDDLWKLKGAK